MASVILLTQFIPSDIGHGGQHRTYQLHHDLEQLVGKDNVILISYLQWDQEVHQHRKRKNFWCRLSGRAKYLANHYLENPVRLFAPTTYKPHSSSSFSSPEFLAYYEQIIKNMKKPVVCVVENTGFADCIARNTIFGIPTIGAVQNLESLDQNASMNYNRHQVLVNSIDFANEVHTLAQCRARLFISKVETGLVGGLGLLGHYYPYLPVGLIQQRFQLLRKRRAETNTEPGLFLLLGSATHATTRESFLWFLQQAQMHGLPEATRIIVGGYHTDRLAPSNTNIPGMEFRGWIAQDELDYLMTVAQGILVPQRLGFGALTRLPEFTCAGIPCIVSKHPTNAVELPPGIAPVDDEWEAWCNAMKRVVQQDMPTTPAEYDEWAHNRTNTLQTETCKLLSQ